MCANAANGCFHLTMVLDDTWTWDPRKETKRDVLQYKAWRCLQHYANLLVFSTSRINNDVVRTKDREVGTVYVWKIVDS